MGFSTKHNGGFGLPTKNPLRWRGTSFSTVAVAATSTSATSSVSSPATFVQYAEDNRFFGTLSSLVLLGSGGRRNLGIQKPAFINTGVEMAKPNN